MLMLHPPLMHHAQLATCSSLYVTCALVAVPSMQRLASNPCCQHARYPCWQHSNCPCCPETHTPHSPLLPHPRVRCLVQAARFAASSLTKNPGAQRFVQAGLTAGSSFLMSKFKQLHVQAMEGDVPGQLPAGSSGSSSSLSPQQAGGCSGAVRLLVPSRWWGVCVSRAMLQDC